MAEHAAARLHIGDGIALQGPGNAGQGGQVGQLEISHQGRGLGAREADHGVVGHAHLAEHGGARAGQALAKAAPVIEALHAGLRGGHDGVHGLVFLARLHRARHHGHPVGIQRARAVELAPVQPPPAGLRIGHQGGLQRAQGARAHLGGGIAEHGAARGQRQPAGLGGGIAVDEHAVQKAEVRAQDLGDVGVGLGQLGPQREQLLHAGAGPAKAARHAQRGEAAVTQPGDGFMGQAARAFALGRTLGDAVEHRAKTRLQGWQRGRVGIGRAVCGWAGRRVGRRLGGAGEGGGHGFANSKARQPGLPARQGRATGRWGRVAKDFNAASARRRGWRAGGRPGRTGAGAAWRPRRSWCGSGPGSAARARPGGRSLPRSRARRCGSG